MNDFDNFAKKMKFKEGDKVRFLNESGGGIVKKILNKELALVEIEDGLAIPFVTIELVKVDEKVKSNDKKGLFKKKEQPSGGLSRLIIEKEDYEDKSVSKRHIKRNVVALEIDLHIENIIDRYKHLSNGEIITIQLNFFQAKLETAIRNKVNNIVFIHGVGNGVLKSEIRKILNNYSGIRFNDASFGRYGFGATEVTFY